MERFSMDSGPQLMAPHSSREQNIYVLRMKAFIHGSDDLIHGFPD